jgi:hypothetical protein
MSISLVFALTVFATAAEPSALTLCKLDKEVRTLKVSVIENGQCRSIYTKYGKEQNIGEAQNVASCESFANRVRSTLEKAGWNCREIKDASSSTLNETVE